MTEEEQVRICKVIAASCMGGNEAVAANIVDRFQRSGFEGLSRDWQSVYCEVVVDVKCETVGFVESEDELRIYINLGYYLGNYRPGELSVIRPDGDGLARYVRGELADEYGKLYDPWNYYVWGQRRRDAEYKAALANWSA